MVICHEGNDAIFVPSRCCDYPYILNGGLYYNCTLNVPFRNVGCYRNGEWVVCQPPAGMLNFVLMVVDFFNSNINILQYKLFSLTITEVIQGHTFWYTNRKRVYATSF